MRIFGFILILLLGIANLVSLARQPFTLRSNDIDVDGA